MNERRKRYLISVNDYVRNFLGLKGKFKLNYTKEDYTSEDPVELNQSHIGAHDLMQDEAFIKGLQKIHDEHYS